MSTSGAPQDQDHHDQRRTPPAYARSGCLTALPIPVVTPAGQIIPFDTYNLFYRNGRIYEIRAAMDRATAREGVTA